jgi:GntR family transcriptional repressor for pyruvate dehydrogenase complex
MQLSSEVSVTPSLRADLRPPKVAELVAADIRRRIVSGALTPGDSLAPEASMMRDYGIARPTLREALRLLENDQLLTVRRGSHLGWRVRLPDPSLTARSVTMLLELRGATLRDVYTARTIFEPPACRMAAERVTTDAVALLRSTLADELAADDDRLRYPVVAWRFHTELAELSGNATLAVLARALQMISQNHASRAIATRWDKRMWRTAYRAHEKLVDLIASGEGAQAETFWRRHMELAGDHLLRDVGDLPISEVI